MLRGLLIGVLLAAGLLGGSAFAQSNDFSDDITTGGTSQVAITAKPAGQIVFVQNPSTETETLWVNFGAVAAATVANTTNGESIALLPGGSLSLATTQSVNVVASDTGHVFVAKTLALAGVDNPGSGSGGGDASAANQTTGNASLSVMDDWDETDRAKVNTIVGQAGIAAGAGAVSATTTRTVSATDDLVVSQTATLAADVAAVETAILNSQLATTTPGTPAASGNTVEMQGVEAGIPVPVRMTTSVVSVTPTIDTAAMASGDLLVDTAAIAGAVRVNDGTALLVDVVVIDEDDEGSAFDIYILNANNDAGTINSAPSISDANASALSCLIRVAAADYMDQGGAKVAFAKPYTNNCLVKAATGTTSVYFYVVNGSGSQTYTAADDLVFKFKFAHAS